MFYGVDGRILDKYIRIHIPVDWSLVNFLLECVFHYHHPSFIHLPDVENITVISQTTVSNVFSLSIDTISLNFVPIVPINNNPALLQIMAWCRPSEKPLSEPTMTSLLTHIWVTRPQCWHGAMHVNPDMNRHIKKLQISTVHQLWFPNNTLCDVRHTFVVYLLTAIYWSCQLH